MWTLHLKSSFSWVHVVWFGGVYLNLNTLIWKYELISHVCMHLILFTSSDNYWGIYLKGYLYTSSENMNSYLMSMCTSSHSLHLVHFIWQLPGGYILSEGTPHLKTWPNSVWGQVIWKWGGTSYLRVHLIWKLDLILPGDRSSENGGSAHLRIHLIWKYEVTSKFTLASQKVFSYYIWKT